jgi:hypothetical protein
MSTNAAMMTNSVSHRLGRQFSRTLDLGIQRRLCRIVNVGVMPSIITRARLQA